MWVVCVTTGFVVVYVVGLIVNGFAWCFWFLIMVWLDLRVFWTGGKVSCVDFSFLLVPLLLVYVGAKFGYWWEGFFLQFI